MEENDELKNNIEEETKEESTENVTEPSQDENSEVKAKVEQKINKTLSINKKTSIMAIAIILVLIIAAIILAYTLPMGAYERTTDADGNIILVQGSYSQERDLSRLAWWKVILSPFLVLGESGNVTLIAIIALLLVIGAVFNALDQTNILDYMVRNLKHKYSSKKYFLLFLLTFLFMFLATACGVFEEIIPLIPIFVLLAYGFGWDSIVALAMSVLAAAFGYVSSVVNPFTIGVAQKICGAYSDIAMFSGVGMRILTFVVMYIILMAFLFPYAKMIEKKPQRSFVYKEDLERKLLYNFDEDTFIYEEKKSKALKWCGCWFLSIFLIVILSIFIQPKFIPALGDFALADYVLYIIVAIYIIAGIGSCVICGFKGAPLLKSLGKGLITLIPVAGLVLIVSGIRYIIEAGNVMDTIIYTLIESASDKSLSSVVIIIYLAVIVLEAFIPSGSAKAFLIMPMIAVICQHLGINPQVACLAFIYGDGICNVFMPTNAALLLMLGMTSVSYPKWFKWNLPVMIVAFGATCGLLMLALHCVY